MNEYKYDEITIGQEVNFSKEMTIKMEEAFREISGDVNPMHYDDEYAKDISNGKVKGHISFGMLTASLCSTLAGVYMPGKYSLIHSLEKLEFRKPVYAGDVLNVQGVVADKVDGLNLIVLKVKITNQNNDIVAKAIMKILVQQ